MPEGGRPQEKCCSMSASRETAKCRMAKTKPVLVPNSSGLTVYMNHRTFKSLFMELRFDLRGGNVGLLFRLLSPTEIGDPLTFSSQVPPASQSFHLSSEISEQLLDGLAQKCLVPGQ